MGNYWLDWFYVDFLHKKVVEVVAFCLILIFFRFYGCYESLATGSTTRALQDLTGGIVQSFGLTHQDRYLTFQVLNSAVPRSSLLIATIAPVKLLYLYYFIFLCTLYFNVLISSVKTFTANLLNILNIFLGKGK